MEEEDTEEYWCPLCEDTGVVTKIEWTDTDTSYEVKYGCNCRDE